MNAYIEKMLTAAIKNHNIERSDDSFDMTRFNKGLKVIEMKIYPRDAFVTCYNGEKLTRYCVVCSFKAPKYENNVVLYQVNMYSNGDMGIYFDGTEYRA